MKRAFVVLAVLIIVIALAASFAVTSNVPKPPREFDEFVGIAYGGNSVADAKLLIDKVKGYTNLFVLQSGVLQRDLDSIDEVGDYAVSNGLSFLPYFGAWLPSAFPSWVESAHQKWGTRFLGVYYDDELGGKMLDDNVALGIDAATGNSIMKTRYGDIVVHKPGGVVVHYEIGGVVHLSEPSDSTVIINRTEAIDVYATFYPNDTITVTPSDSSGGNRISTWNSTITYGELMQQRPLKTADEIAWRFNANYIDKTKLVSNLTTAFTSDYALYWFNYQLGYDVALAQIGWNVSLAQQIALVRGAATMQNKEWGAIITWKYSLPPYLDSGSEILQQMKTAYQCGAKYIVLFDYYEESSGQYGTLQEEHFEALETFWIDTMNGPTETCGSIKAQTALVLPANYGSGLRYKDDKIWGVLLSDEKSDQIWTSMQSALADKAFNLDIVYDDPNFPMSGRHPRTVYWNQTR